MEKKQKKEVKYSEADLIKLFQLNRLNSNQHTEKIKLWLDVPFPILTDAEQVFFDIVLIDAQNHIEGWNEEELKTKFVSMILRLGHLADTKKYHTYCEREVFATVENIYLYLKSDFMIAKGILDKPEIPYFYFQEYKKMKDPSGDPVPQLIEGFLIAQELNKNNKPLYGCTITGKFWDFFLMEQRTYCISQSYDCTKRDDLLQIVAILRKFKEILEIELLD
jgi:hypothetical protein